EFSAGNLVVAQFTLGERALRIEQLEPAPRITGCDPADRLVDRRIGAKRQRIPIAREAEFLCSAFDIPDTEVSSPQSKMQLRQVIVEPRGCEIVPQRFRAKPGGFSGQSARVSRFPLSLVALAERAAMQRRDGR